MRSRLLPGQKSDTLLSLSLSLLRRQQSRPSVSASSSSYQTDEPVFEPSARPSLTNSGAPPYPQRPTQPTREASLGSSGPRRGSQSSIGSGDASLNRDTSGASLPSGATTNNPTAMDIGAEIVGQTTQQIKGLFRKPSVTGDETRTGNKEDSEDTMRNLRKTFAGIFGDM